MLKLCTVLIGVQSAFVRRDDHRSELLQQEEKKAASVVQPASTPDGNLAAPVVQPNKYKPFIVSRIVREYLFD